MLKYFFNFNLFYRHKVTKGFVRFENAEPSIQHWINQEKMWRSYEWKNLRSFGESLKNNPLNHNDVDLTAEVIEIEEEDPIVALYSPKLLQDIRRIIGSESVTLHGDATFKIVPKHLFTKERKGKQLFNLMIKYNNRVIMFIN